MTRGIAYGRGSASPLPIASTSAAIASWYSGSPIERRDALDRSGQRGGEVVDCKRAVQAHFHQADLLALPGEVLHRLLHCLCAGAHHDDHALGVGRADV